MKENRLQSPLKAWDLRGNSGLAPFASKVPVPDFAVLFEEAIAGDPKEIL